MLHQGRENRDAWIQSEKEKKKRVTTRWLVTILIFGTISKTMIAPAVPKLLLASFHNQAGEAAQYMATILSAVCGFSLFSAPAFGAISDAIGRKPLLLLSLAVSAVGMLLWAFIPTNLTAIACVNIIASVFDVQIPMVMAMMGDLNADSLSDDSRRAKDFGMTGVAMSAATILAVPLGGYLTDSTSIHFCLLASACSGSIALLVATFAIEETFSARKRSSQPFSCEVATPLPGFRLFAEKRELWSLTVPLVAKGLTFAMGNVVSLFSNARYGWETKDLSWFMTTESVMAVLAQGFFLQTFVPSFISPKQAVLLSLALSVIYFMMGGLSKQGWMLFASSLLTSLRYIGEPCMVGLMSNAISSEHQGKLQGAVASLNMIAMLASSPLYGALAQYGLSPAMVQRYPAECPSGYTPPANLEGKCGGLFQLPYDAAALISLTGLFLTWYLFSGDLRIRAEPSLAANEEALSLLAGDEEEGKMSVKTQVYGSSMPSSNLPLLELGAPESALELVQLLPSAAPTKPKIVRKQQKEREASATAADEFYYKSVRRLSASSSPSHTSASSPTVGPMGAGISSTNSTASLSPCRSDSSNFYL